MMQLTNSPIYQQSRTVFPAICGLMHTKLTPNDGIHSMASLDLFVFFFFNPTLTIRIPT